MSRQAEAPFPGATPETRPGPAIPAWRTIARQGIAQARRVHDRTMRMQETLLNVTTDAALVSWSGARDVSQRMVTFADVNVTAALDHAERVLQARTPREAGVLHQEYLRDQARCVAQQTREIHDLAAKALGEALGAVVPTK
ncbi:hypothetical protein M446_0784 [Methylobacterium sp. 4-46]|nr:hypothetical protein M446_0784 [Methylobacterium sp. 4-46]